VESIRIFPDAGAVSTELEAAGLKVESVRRFVFGIAALHIAAKPLNGGQERRDDRR
jgi:ubiquinone/menaquinone biosynthesis C-methylase UbiE